jgi:hypothetical protein
MTLGKSSSADSEGPVPFGIAFPADEECCIQKCYCYRQLKKIKDGFDS